MMPEYKKRSVVVKVKQKTKYKRACGCKDITLLIHITQHRIIHQPEGLAKLGNVKGRHVGKTSRPNEIGGKPIKLFCRLRNAATATISWTGGRGFAASRVTVSVAAFTAGRRNASLTGHFINSG